MELLRPHSVFTRHVAQLLKEPFTLIDVGCSRGIHGAFRNFGSQLRAFGFDASIEEYARLSTLEKNPQVEYVAGLVGLPVDHPLRGKLTMVGNPFERFSAY